MNATKRFQSRVVAVIGCSLLPAHMSSAGPSAVHSLPGLAATAELIIIAEPDAGPVPDRAFNLQARRTLKGEPLLSPVRTRWPAAVTISQPPRSLHGIWFLARNPQNPEQWTILPPASAVDFADELMLPVPAADLPGPYQYAPGDPVLDKVVQELRASIAAETDAWALSRLYEMLGTVTRPRATLAYAHIAELGPAHVESCPTVKLIRDWAILVAPALEERVRLAQDVPLGLQAALCTLSDNRVVPALHDMIEAIGIGPGPVQRCVARALRNIHSKEALPELARFFDSLDPELQYVVVRGFALFANNHLPGDEGTDTPQVRGPWTTKATLEHAPSLDVYAADPQKYLDFWRAWWSCRPCRLDETPPVVSLTSPADGAVLSGVVPLGATATDNVGVAGVRFFARRQPVGPEDTESPYQASWDTTSVPDGRIQVWAEARDLITNRTMSQPAMVTVDNTPPTLAGRVVPAELSPPDCQMVPVNAVVDAWDARDPQPRVQLVSITCGACDAQNDVAGAVYGRDDREFSLRARAEGPSTGRTYSITYSATDDAGNAATVVATVVVPTGAPCE